MGKRNALALFLLAGVQMEAQRLYVGVKAGTPLSDSTSSALVGSRLIGSGLSTLNVRRYTLGPSVEFRLWRGLHVEADALYKRLDRTEHYTFFSTRVERLTANTWEVPYLFKWSFGRTGFQPFASVGGTFRRLAATAATREVLPDVFTPREVAAYDPKVDMTQGGYVTGGGMRISAFRRLKITPELRYTRWTSGTLFPTRNQFEFLLGVGF